MVVMIHTNPIIGENIPEEAPILSNARVLSFDNISSPQLKLRLTCFKIFRQKQNNHLMRKREFFNKLSDKKNERLITQC